MRSTHPNKGRFERLDRVVQRIERTLVRAVATVAVAVFVGLAVMIGIVVWFNIFPPHETGTVMRIEDVPDVGQHLKALGLTMQGPVTFESIELYRYDEFALTGTVSEESIRAFCEHCHAPLDLGLELTEEKARWWMERLTNHLKNRSSFEFELTGDDIWLRGYAEHLPIILIAYRRRDGKCTLRVSYNPGASEEQGAAPPEEPSPSVPRRQATEP